MKQNPDFCAELFKYNRVHRLIGNVSCETLVKESLSAIKAASLDAYTVMVDIGAGSGVLGYAWLKSSLGRRVILLEPDRKASGFLVGYFSADPRARVISKKIEDLSLDELLSFESDAKKIFCAARAFSSNIALDEAYAKSGLPFSLYSFSKNGEKTENSFALLQKK